MYTLTGVEHSWGVSDARIRKSFDHEESAYCHLETRPEASEISHRVSQAQGTCYRAYIWRKRLRRALQAHHHVMKSYGEAEMNTEEVRRYSVARLDGKVALITGGAAGIGRQTALKFAEEGAKVVITDINEDDGNKALEELKKVNDDALFLRHDVTKEEDWKSVVSEIVNEYGRLDILFNNAGIYIIKPIVETDVETWDKLMDINVKGVFLGMKHVLPEMEKNQSGSIINASSLAGLKGSANHVLYGASKGAVRVMTKDAAAEYAQKGIRINSIHPGYITTGMADYAEEATRASREELGSMFPMGRMGDPQEVTNLVLFLASDESSFSTAAEFVIDGGASNIL